MRRGAWLLLVFLAACSSGAGTKVASSTSTSLPGAATFEPTAATGVIPPGVPMPNPTLTPGAVATDDLKLLCTSGYTQKVRDVPESEKLQVFREYGVDPARSGDYEVDHLVSLELGGSNDIKNLWPEPYAGDWGARTKDRVENRLHFDICRGATSAETAQHEIATNWYAAFVALLGSPDTTTTPTAPPSTAAPLPVVTSPSATAPPPTAAGHPAGATARCNDGTYSYAAHHQGACSHHGGVAEFYD